MRRASSLSYCYRYFPLDLLEEKLPTYSELLSTSATITLLLPDLDGSTFSCANAAYASFFGRSPPARACVGVGGVGVALDCLAWAGELSVSLDNKMATKQMRGETGARKALHVQSLSYWAPANIGPYSQAISVRGHPLSLIIFPILPKPSSFPPSLNKRVHFTDSTLYIHIRPDRINTLFPDSPIPVFNHIPGIVDNILHTSARDGTGPTAHSACHSCSAKFWVRRW